MTIKVFCHEYNFFLSKRNKKKIQKLFIDRVSPVSPLHSHYEEVVYFLQLSINVAKDLIGIFYWVSSELQRGW